MKALLFLLAGCDGVFGLDTVPPRGTDAAVPDVAVVAPDAAVCIDGAADVERFDDPNVICPWGFFDHGGFDYTIANGEITLMPMANMPGAQAGCGSFGAVAFGSFGQYIELAQLGGGYSYLFFRVVWPDTTTESRLQQNGADIDYIGAAGTTRGSITFDATATRFLRLRPDTDGVVAEYSADAKTWQLIGRDPTPPPATVKPELEYGTPGPNGDPNPTTAVIAGINACP